MEFFPTYRSSHKYIIVAINYFTKWVEAMLTFDNMSYTTTHVFFNQVITCFDVPKKMVFGHDTHF